MKKQVIAYLHTHWDREWYREFEVFRLRLIRVFDNVLKMLEEGKIPSFYFDGQTAALQDYLEIRPEKTKLVKKLIKEKKLFIGPFYCLVDEFLCDKRSFEKSLEMGLKYAKKMGCKDFLGYFADTFGHCKNVLPILKKFKIDKCIVWRGCGDIPADFKWCGVDTINLVRGYFMDFFSAPLSIDEKAKAIRKNLDMIAEKSGDVLLMPIGGDHLGVPTDIAEQIEEVNKRLDDYEIKIGSIFEYIEKVDFSKFEVDDELRDNSKTFVLPGCYSSRLDLKKYHSKCVYLLDIVENLYGKKYKSELDYAFKLLLQNLAHDGICGCATDLVHKENIMRYEKILQIARTILAQENFDPREHFDGVVEFESVEKLDNQCVSTRMGFAQDLLYDTLKVPVTEDFREVYTYLDCKKDGEIFVSDTELKNEFVDFCVKDNKMFVCGAQFDFKDYVDNGDSYNFGPLEYDMGANFKVISSMKTVVGDCRCGLEVVVQQKGDKGSLLDKQVMLVEVSLDKGAKKIDFKVKWDNVTKNHLLQARFKLQKSIEKTYSADMGKLLERHFDPDYDIRKNLPKTRGYEAKTNTAPMFDYVWAQGLGIKTVGLREYEIKGNNLLITLLRGTGTISNPKNSSRSTPAGPPLATEGLQMLGENICEFSVTKCRKNDWQKIFSEGFRIV